MDDQVPPQHPGTELRFELSEFFPYKVRVFYRAVSEAVKDVYTNVSGITMAEWRTMVVLGPDQRLSAGEIVDRSSMDPVNVSRAISGLTKAGLLDRHTDPTDRRRVMLRLTKQGRETLKTLVPLVREVEESLLHGLEEDERNTLMRLMTKVRANAEALPTYEQRLTTEKNKFDKGSNT